MLDGGERESRQYYVIHDLNVVSFDRLALIYQSMWTNVPMPNERTYTMHTTTTTTHLLKGNPFFMSMDTTTKDIILTEPSSNR